jgi:DNA-binding NarL/FixJ family response regulator
LDPTVQNRTSFAAVNVDDDSELREALVEQLALHEEFESIAVDNGTKGLQTAKAGQIDLVIMIGALKPFLRRMRTASRSGSCGYSSFLGPQDRHQPGTALREIEHIMSDWTSQ